MALFLRIDAQLICEFGAYREDVKIDVTIDGLRPRREMLASANLFSINIKNPGYWYKRFKTADTLRVRAWNSCSDIIETSFDITGSPNVELDEP